MSSGTTGLVMACRRTGTEVAVVQVVRVLGTRQSAMCYGGGMGAVTLIQQLCGQGDSASECDAIDGAM